MSVRLLRILLTAVLLALAAAPAPAHAAFPGENGKIAFTKFPVCCDSITEIYTINPDGTGETRITNDSNSVQEAAWSPDGSRIAFARDACHDPDSCGNDFHVWVMNADGTARQDLGRGEAPSWSPDGAKLVFASSTFESIITVMNHDGTGRQSLGVDGGMPAWSPDGRKIAFVAGIDDIHVMNADGTQVENLTNHGLSARSYYPDWSPDGSRIVFMELVQGFGTSAEIFVMNADGGAKTNITNNAVPESNPSWSPDGQKIVFHKSEPETVGAIYIMNTDGSGQTRIVSGYPNNWQPILRGYPRPQAGALFRVPLAIAYDECPSGAANRTHGPALTAPSCNPATPASAHLTVGTLDANGKSTQAVGRVKYVACVTGTTASGECSTPAGMSSPDVRVEAMLNDVRLRGALSDYSGELEVTQTLRITDKQNSPAPPNGASGTVSDLPISYTVPCTPTPGPADVGSSCSVLTRLNALIPGSVVACKRSNWEISQVEVSDGGLDGSASTAPNTVFARQGIFIP